MHFKVESVQKSKACPGARRGAKGASAAGQGNMAHGNGTAHGKKFREPFRFREQSILLPV